MTLISLKTDIKLNSRYQIKFLFKENHEKLGTNFKLRKQHLKNVTRKLYKNLLVYYDNVLKEKVKTI